MKETKKTKRHIGIDLHSATFTLAFLQEGADSEIYTLLLKGGLDRFIEMLRPDDEIAVEATGNSRWFRAQVRDHVARVVVVTQVDGADQPSELEDLVLDTGLGVFYTWEREGHAYTVSVDITSRQGSEVEDYKGSLGFKYRF